MMKIMDELRSRDDEVNNAVNDEVNNGVDDKFVELCRKYHISE